jgi:hypothetical protein
VAAHFEAARDSAWATVTEATISSHASALLGERGVVVATDCRTTSCAIAIEWSSIAVARESWAPLVSNSLGVNCQQEIVLPASAPLDAPCRATLLMSDCLRE